MAERHSHAHFSRLTSLDSSQRQQRHALRRSYTGHADDVHSLVTAIAPKGVQMCAIARIPQPRRPVKLPLARSSPSALSATPRTAFVRPSNVTTSDGAVG